MHTADGVAWSGAPLKPLAQIRSLPDLGQLLACAVLLRLYVGFMFQGGQSRALGLADQLKATRLQVSGQHSRQPADQR